MVTVSQFTSRADALAAIVEGKSSPAGGLVPVGWLAMSLPEGDIAGGGSRWPDGDKVLLVRAGPWRIALPAMEVTTSDRLGASVQLSLVLWPVCQAVELASLARTLWADALLVREVADRVAPAVTEFVRRAAADRDAVSLVERTPATEFAGGLSAALAEWLFRSGLELREVSDLLVRSGDYDRQRSAQRQATLAAELGRIEQQLMRQRDAARDDQVTRLAAAVSRLHELSGTLAGSDDPRERAARLADLLVRLEPDERDLIASQSLQFDVAVAAPPTILLAAGRSLFRVNDPACGSVALPWSGDGASRIGPLRSLSVHAGGVLVGGRDGVAAARMVDGRLHAECAWLLPEARRRTGVNSAVRVGDDLLAAHSEVGLMRWRSGEATPQELVRGGSGRSVRALVQVDESQVLFALDQAVMRFDPREAKFAADTLLLASAAVTAIAADTPGECWAGDQDGALWRIGADGQSQATVRAGGPVWSLQSAVVGLLWRVVLSAGPAGLVLFQPRLGAISRLPAPGGTRQAVCAGGWTVAISGDRRALLYWPPGHAGSPATVLPMPHPIHACCAV